MKDERDLEGRFRGEKDPTPRPEAVFDATWLELREPVDHRSRSEELVTLLREWMREPKDGGGPSSASRAPHWRRIVDLGSGTGSNLRYLAPRLDTAQEWTLTDHDPQLLERATPPETPPGIEVELRRVRRDLGRDPGRVIVGEEATGAELVTASAFLDLASRPWIEALVEACRVAGAAGYIALTYDGTIRWWTDRDARQPLSADGPSDRTMEEIVNAHQRREKGLGGVALGPDAAPAAAESFRRAGFRTWLRPSPWRLGPDDAPRVRKLLEGWAEAAVEESPERAAEIRAWVEPRRRTVDEGTFGVTVGHLDLLALPCTPDEGP